MTGRPSAQTNGLQLVTVHGMAPSRPCSPAAGAAGHRAPEHRAHYLPAPESRRRYLRCIPPWRAALGETVDAVTAAEEQLARLRSSPAIADQLDRAWADDWLHRSYLNF